MKLTNTVIKKLIKEELVKLQEQGAGCPPGQKWDQAADGGQGDCVRDPAAPPPPTAIKKSEKADKSKRLGRSMRRGGGAAARTLINRACFGARVTGKAMRAAKKANKCPESRLTYKDWVAGRRAARKNDIDTVEKLIAAAGGSADVGTAEDKAPLEFAQDTAPEQKVQAVMKKFGTTEEEAAKIVAAAQTVSENDAELLAQDLYKAMKGAGTDEKKAYGAFRYLKTDGDINALTRAYDRVLIQKKDTGDGGLYQWLVDDGLDDLAKKVSDAGKNWGKKIVSSGDVAEKAASAPPAAATPLLNQLEKLEDNFEPAHSLAIRAAKACDPRTKDANDISNACMEQWLRKHEEAVKKVLKLAAARGVQPGGTDVVKESQTPTFSSFPDQQKLFENWNYYLKED